MKQSKRQRAIPDGRNFLHKMELNIAQNSVVIKLNHIKIVYIYSPEFEQIYLEMVMLLAEILESCLSVMQQLAEDTA